MPNAFRIFPTLTKMQCFGLFLTLILLCTMIGSLARGTGYFSLFWPANAVVLAFMSRFPSLRSSEAWLGAICGYFFGELLSGSSLGLAVCFTVANLLIVGTVLMLYVRFRNQIRTVHRGYSYLLVFFFCGIGSLVGGLFQILVLPSIAPDFGAYSPWIAVGLFASSELLMAILIIPIIFSTPPFFMLNDSVHRFRKFEIPIYQFFPVLALVASIVASYYDNGPGSILFPIAALIWCALSYRHFPLTLLTGLTCIAILYHISIEMLSISSGNTTAEQQLNIISARLGIIMMALAPLTVSIINNVRNQLIHELKHTLAHDELTNIFTRRQFFKLGIQKLKRSIDDRFPIAVLMIDIDHFKKINDQYGHQAGDKALQICAFTIQESLRREDIFGRLGGEEFAVILHDVDENAAFMIADRIRQRLSENVVQINEQTAIHIHISIGIASSEKRMFYTLETLLNHADKALYKAKGLGRNQVQVSA